MVIREPREQDMMPHLQGTSLTGRSCEPGVRDSGLDWLCQIGTTWMTEDVHMLNGPGGSGMTLASSIFLRC